MESLRKVFVVNGDEEVQVKMIDLRKGDMFRLEPADETDLFVDNCEYFYAVSDGYLDKNGVGAVDVSK